MEWNFTFIVSSEIPKICKDFIFSRKKYLTSGLEVATIICGVWCVVWWGVVNLPFVAPVIDERERGS